MDNLKMFHSSLVITGAAGFISSHLIERLINDKKYMFNKIYLIDNLVRTNSLRNIKHLLKLDHRLEFIHADISTCNFEEFIDPFTVSSVFHLAATRINRCNNYNLEGHQYIATGGARLIDWISKYNDIKIFFASSASVYQKPIKLPIKETAKCDPTAIYGSGKLYTENLLKSYNKLHSLEYVVNRFFSVYGIRMDNTGVYTEVIFNWLNQIKKGDKDIFINGNPDEKILDLIYVDDVVDAILLTMEKSRNSIFNVSTQRGITLTKLIDIIEEIVDTKLNRVLIKEDRTDIEKVRIGDITKLKYLGWEQKTSLREGLIKTWEWICGKNQ